MTAFHVVAAIAGMVLIVYLVTALINPERF